MTYTPLVRRRKTLRGASGRSSVIAGRMAGGGAETIVGGFRWAPWWCADREPPPNGASSVRDLAICSPQPPTAGVAMPWSMTARHFAPALVVTALLTQGADPEHQRMTDA